jgi:mono/diheme cytochrome c family protein
MNAKLPLLGASLVALLALGCPQDKPAQPTQPASQVQPAQPATQAAQPAEPAQPAQPVAAAPSVDEGKKLYFTGCANCHGPDGTGAMMRGMMPKIGDLTSAETHGRLKDDDIATLIKTGRDKMPPFGSVFNENQIKSIVAYVRTLKKG